MNEILNEGVILKLAFICGMRSETAIMTDNESSEDSRQYRIETIKNFPRW